MLSRDFRVVRRVKCDEERPSCKRYTSTGRRCDGYQAELLLGTSKSVTSQCTLTPAATTSLPNLQLSRIPSLELAGNKLERRSFHFFRSRTASQLSGLYGDTFWNLQILQAAHYQPSIKHAIIAPGSLPERFEKCGLISRQEPKLYQGDFALQENSSAIQTLVG